MNLSCGPRHNIAFLKLRERTAQVEPIRVSDELNVDLSPDGTNYGLELLNANLQLKTSDGGRLIVVNEELGKQSELPLTG